MYIHTYKHMYVCVYIYTRVCVYTHTHVCICNASTSALGGAVVLGFILSRTGSQERYSMSETTLEASPLNIRG